MKNQKKDTGSKGSLFTFMLQELRVKYIQVVFLVVGRNRCGIPEILTHEETVVISNLKGLYGDSANNL